MSVVQLRAPQALRARVLSLYLVALGTIYPLGAVLQGALGDRLGLRAVTAGTAAAFAVLMALVRRLRPEWVAALDEPRDTAPEADDRADDGAVMPDPAVPLPAAGA